MTASELLATLLADGPFARGDAPYRLVEVIGADAGDFLQRLCSQDVLGLDPGAVAPAAFLDAKGKLQVTCLVGRRGDSFVLEVQAPQAPRLLELLERYHFTEKLQIAALDPGPCGEQIAAAGGPTGVSSTGGDGLLVRFARRGVHFHRVYDRGAAPVGAPLSEERAECLRMLAGLVRVGVETEASTLALEAQLDDHCSTTKGCYTGQEVVARIHTYGHVNRKLCLLQLAAGERITAPVALHEPEDDIPVGRVVHAVPVPDRPVRLGVGYLPKDFQAIGTRLALAGGGGAVEVIGYEPLPA